MSANIPRILRALREEAARHGCAVEVEHGAHVKVRLLRGDRTLATTTIAASPRTSRYRNPAHHLRWLKKALETP